MVVLCLDNCDEMRFDPVTSSTVCDACDIGYELPTCCHCAREYVLQDSTCVDRGCKFRNHVLNFWIFYTLDQMCIELCIDIASLGIQDLKM